MSFPNQALVFVWTVGAHDAVRKVQRLMAQGCRYVVDIDIEKFFDRVNHDVLMVRVARRIRDKRVCV